MIQNADDAEAKIVQFFVDCRSFGKESLANPALAPFQGPALLSVNDATFSDKDWKGIESLQQSIKADDPFKVGRFGIGFNSVYHLTGIQYREVMIKRPLLADCGGYHLFTLLFW